MTHTYMSSLANHVRRTIQLNSATVINNADIMLAISDLINYISSDDTKFILLSYDLDMTPKCVTSNVEPNLVPVLLKKIGEAINTVDDGQE